MSTEDYMKSWAEQLGVPNNPWAIVEVLVNSVKNYDTACAVMFGLNWIDNKAWLIRARDELAKLPEQYPTVSHFPADWLYNWMTYYTTEVEALPCA